MQDPSAGDSRLALIPKEWLHGKYILDVGCNEGKVTVEIGADAQVHVDYNQLLNDFSQRSCAVLSV